MPDQLTVTETMTVLTCANCGIRFGVPGTWAYARRKDGRGFHCPNGHEMHFRNGKSWSEWHEQYETLQGEVRQLRRQRVQWLHDAEQAGAKAEDAAKAEDGAKAQGPDRGQRDHEDKPADACAPHICPHCGKVYRRPWFLATHLGKVHGDTQGESTLREQIQQARAKS